jgi:small redox-active disulfide protein 2
MLKKLQILGTGCSKCKRLTEQVEQAAKELGIEHQIEKVTDIEQIISFGGMTTPALAVDGQIKVAGNIPSVDELKRLIA